MRAVWIVAVCLVLVGAILIASAFAMNDWSFAGLDTENFETNMHEIAEEFASISIETDTAALTFLPAADGKCRVECYESAGRKHTVSLRDNTLCIGATGQKNWYDHIGISFKSPRITVYLPVRDYETLAIAAKTGAVSLPADFRFAGIDIAVTTGDVEVCASAAGGIRIQTTTGRVRAEGLTADTLDISVTTGKVSLADAVCGGDIRIGVTTGKCTVSHVTCGNLSSEGSTGDISLQNVICAGKITLSRSTGDLRLEGADAAELSLTTDTGDVTGTLLTDKSFAAHTDTGSLDLPEGGHGGRCEIRTDTGDIRISVQKK